MQIMGTLVTALDFKDKDEAPHERYSYQNAEGHWFVVHSGPDYCNIYRVTMCDRAGEECLKAHKRDNP